MIRRKAVLGAHLVQCDRCGMVYRNNLIKKEWTGLLVCAGAGTRNCWEPRHPVDFIRAIKEEPGVRETRARQTQDLSDAYPNGVTADDL